MTVIQEVIMSPNKKTRRILVLPGIVWVVSVTAFYVWYNTAYYGEKIAVFGAFLLKILGPG